MGRGVEEEDKGDGTSVVDISALIRCAVFNEAVDHHFAISHVPKDQPNAKPFVELSVVCRIWGKGLPF